MVYCLSVPLDYTFHNNLNLVFAHHCWSSGSHSVEEVFLQVHDAINYKLYLDFRDVKIFKNDQ